MVLSLNFCTDPSILRVILMFKIVIDIIKIIIPIALIVMVMLDISKYVSSFESNSTIFKKVRGRVFAAALVFLIPSFVNTFLTVVNGTNDYQTSSCYVNANRETIATLEKARDAELLAQTEKERLISSITIDELYNYKEDNQYNSLAEKLVTIAVQEKDTQGGKKYLDDFGADVHTNWCSVFVWWSSWKSGVYPDYVSVKSASVGPPYGFFVEPQTSNAVWHDSYSFGDTSYVPKMGDYIFFRFSPNHVVSHIGIVVKVEGETITFVHGNTGGNDPLSTYVRVGTTSIKKSTVLGYGSWY